MATNKKTMKREILPADQQKKVVGLLQANLVTVIDLALFLKQAHWSVVGRGFRSVHLQLDEIIESVREGSDEIAERISTLGAAPDGRSSTVSDKSKLKKYPEGFQKAPTTVSLVADALKTTVDQLRNSIAKLGDLDPISEDLCIGISAGLEKHLWMVQSQEV
ncbi:Fine tangled pili major subunit [Roseimaritima multifibrata]|uniref:Fine tangled pili major subunit n=1 Tax=Roseimaritima multifibrata TaxID=1930274 RepID=A0A517MG35_9BACT|nr:DNA starvation/stationary phase protection protein [Roseimaritima multifibrata]QDS93851.1 Fine tangled pili major subunit [Roseimaritima multifibrata]